MLALVAGCVIGLGSACSPGGDSEAAPDPDGKPKVWLVRGGGWTSPMGAHGLEGWKPTSDANWRLEDGVIRVDDGEPGFLLTEKPYGDFELSLTFWSPLETNSGIFLRMTEGCTEPATGCYEVNIAPPSHPFPTGSLVARAVAQAVPPPDPERRFDGGVTRDLLVRLQGGHITVYIDGARVVDYLDPEPLPPAAIGLQFREGDVRFADLQVRALDPAGSAVDDQPGLATTPEGTFITWREHRVDDQGISGVALRGADGLQMADLDGDGYEDVISVHEDSSHLRLAFGTDDPDRWELVTLAEGEDVDTIEDVAVGDVDQDGDLDLLAAAELDHLIYFENPLTPGGASAVRSGVWDSHKPSMTVDRGSWIRAFLADLDGDGDLEATAPNKGAVLYAGLTAGDPDDLRALSWFSIDGDPLDDASWTEHELRRIGVPINLRPVDLDGDGDLDLIAGSRAEARVFWFENLIERGSLAFEEHPIEVSGRSVPQESGAKRLTGMNMAFADLDHDGDLDVVLQETPFTNVWLEQPSDRSEPWSIHPIGSVAPDSPTGVTLADIDGDGDLDLITGGYSQEPRDRDGPEITAQSRVGRIAWFENRMSGDATTNAAWARHDISRRVRGMNDMFIARDLDGDGDLDFMTTRGNSGEFDGVLWLEQVRSETPRRAFTAARAFESRALPLPAGD